MADVTGLAAKKTEGPIPHDANVASGNPLPMGAIAQDMDDTAPPNQVSAEGDAFRVAGSRDGGVFVHPHGPRIWSVSAEHTVQRTDFTVKAAPGAGLSLYITDIFLATDDAVDVTIEEGITTLKWKYYSAGQGDGVALRLNTPIKLAANTLLSVTTSAVVNVTLVVCGYTAP